MRTISLPAIDKTVSLSAYIGAVKLAKANPEREFKQGLTTWWAVKGKDIVNQFVEGMQDRITQGKSYSERGIK